MGKLTDRQQAEYLTAYQDYITHMSQVEATGSGTDRAAHLLSHEDEQDGYKSFKRGSKLLENKMNYSQDSGLLHPITEEDEKPERSVRRSKGPGPRYHSVPCEEDECGPKETDATPLLWDDPQEDLRIKSFGTAVMDKKESSDSGMRSSASSSNRSLQDEESEEVQNEDKQKSKGMDEQDRVSTVRMSICSEAMSEASSPEENWGGSHSHSNAITNLNEAPSGASPQNNNNNNDEERSLIISPGSSTNIRALPHNLLAVRPKRSSSTTTQDIEASEERESVL